MADQVEEAEIPRGRPKIGEEAGMPGCAGIQAADVENRNPLSIVSGLGHTRTSKRSFLTYTTQLWK
jgi:hypothetical protein